jgi:hypothetical protein
MNGARIPAAWMKDGARSRAPKLASAGLSR